MHKLFVSPRLSLRSTTCMAFNPFSDFGLAERPPNVVEIVSETLSPVKSI